MPTQKLTGARLAGALADLVIVVATIFAGLWWWWGARSPVSHRTTDVEMGFRIGQRAVVAGIDWSQSERTLFLAVQSNCPACSASVAYYRTLFDACGRAMGCRDLVVAAEPTETVRAWLRQNDISARHVATVTVLSAPGLHTAPTVAIVDSDGIITDLNVGLLNADEEARFLARVLRQPGAAVAAPRRQLRVIGVERSLPLAMRQPNVVLLDVRERDECTRDRHRGAVCLPLPELAARAPAEYDRGAVIIVDCSRVTRNLCLRATERLILGGFNSVSAAVVQTGAGSVEER